MRIAVVDDEEIFLNQVSEVVKKELPEMGIARVQVDRFSSANEFFPSWSSQKYQVIFLDIYIDNDNGVDIARRIRETDEDVTIIFCTTSNEFAAQSYEVEARYYLQKPITEEKVASMMKRVNFVRLEKNQAIVLPDGYRCILHRILYTNYMNHNVVYYIDGAEPHNVYMSHADAEKLLLTHEEFCTINKGSIVNLGKVCRITKNSFEMKNGDELPISRRRYKEVADAYTTYKFKQMEADM